MKLLLDMNMSPLWLPVLHGVHLEAVHWSSVGKATAPDSEIMQFAKDHDMAVLTQDLDFGILLAMSGAAGPSVIQLRAEDALPHAIGERVVASLRVAQAELELGALVTIDTKRTRIRVLPLR